MVVIGNPLINRRSLLRPVSKPGQSDSIKGLGFHISRPYRWIASD